MSADSLKSERRRRSYTPEFKVDMVAQCLQGDVSLASLAVDHGMNPNVLHRWVTEHERYGKHTLEDNDAILREKFVDMTPANWIPVQPLQVADDHQALSATRPVAPQPKRIQVDRTIEVELAARGLSMTVRWPGDDRQGLVCFARELLA